MAALDTVPCHLFVPRDHVSVAYKNRPLPIGHGQTISQPYIVALMTDLMNLKPHHAVLEIGTGSGYSAAILAERVQTVCTIEIIEPLEFDSSATSVSDQNAYRQRYGRSPRRAADRAGSRGLSR
jgi:protein-L-isoaspartate(D-aspartate) O-methyltransferase